VCLLPGDPARVDLAGRVLDDFTVLGHSREFRVGRGQLRGVPVGVCSTGIGGPSTEIALVELARLGVRTVIRIGGMGALHAGFEPGSLAVVRHAVREGGAARYYLPPERDAIADSGVCAALLAAASGSGRAHREITVLSTDSYYLGQGRALAGMEEMAERRLRHVRELAVDGMDMESETVLAISTALGLAAGVLLVVHGNRATDAWLEDYQDPQLALIRVASEAATRLQGGAGT
jgi:uridine phosphorylase